MTNEVGRSAVGEQFDAPDGEVVKSRPPEKMAADKIQCDACPVLCQISRGRLGACDRWGNVDGVLTRTDPVVFMAVRSHM